MSHFPAQAQRVLQIFCPGAASHMDLWEYKPALEKYDGQPLPGAENFVSFQGKNGSLMQSPWPFVPGGSSGKMISSMLPHMAPHVDDIAFIHSMTSKTNTHGPGCVFMNTGHATEGFPSAGAWLSYALGSANENSADLRGHSRYTRRAAQRQGQLEQRLSARPASGDRDERTAADSQSVAPGTGSVKRRNWRRAISCRRSMACTPPSIPARRSCRRGWTRTNWPRACSSPPPP